MPFIYNKQLEFVDVSSEYILNNDLLIKNNEEYGFYNLKMYFFIYYLID